MKYYLAIDIGASSGRHILGHKEGGRMVLEEIYRFENRQIRKNGHDCWDLDCLWNGVVSGMKEAAVRGTVPETVGIDTWGVDYVLLDASDAMIGDAVSYRDSRTQGAQAAVDRLISPEALYEKTGIQRQPFNTVFQLAAQKAEHPEQLVAAKRFLMIPDYLNFRLTGEKINEYTNATTTGLVNAKEKCFDRELIAMLGYPQEIFGELAMPGTRIGRLLPAIREAVGYDTEVILPATHDTGSAFLAVPATGEDAVYLSSGTWSLLGIENAEPIRTPAGMAANFTNEGGAFYRYRFLKNIMGLWMIQSVRRELNGENYVSGRQNRTHALKKWSFSELEQEAAKTDFTGTVDVNRSVFLDPADMGEAVREECRRTGQPVPQSVGELMHCIYASLALCYGNAVRELESLTGRRFRCLHIVSGGCRDGYLNRLTAKATGLTVYAGPTEGTAIGNLIIQMIAGGEWDSLESARRAVRESFEVQEVTE